MTGPRSRPERFGEQKNTALVGNVTSVVASHFVVWALAGSLQPTGRIRSMILILSVRCCISWLLQCNFFSVQTSACEDSSWVGGTTRSRHQCITVPLGRDGDSSPSLNAHHVEFPESKHSSAVCVLCLVHSTRILTVLWWTDFDLIWSVLQIEDKDYSSKSLIFKIGLTLC